MEISNVRWKQEGSKKTRKAIAMHRDVYNTFHNLFLNLIIINLYIKFGTSNIFQHFHRLSDTSKEKEQKIGQHKFGPGGYSNLAAQIVSIKKPIMLPNNNMQIIFILLHLIR